MREKASRKVLALMTCNCACVLYVVKSQFHSAGGNQAVYYLIIHRQNAAYLRFPFFLFQVFGLVFGVFWFNFLQTYHNTEVMKKLARE